MSEIRQRLIQALGKLPTSSKAYHLLAAAIAGTTNTGEPLPRKPVADLEQLAIEHTLALSFLRAGASSKEWQVTMRSALMDEGSGVSIQWDPPQLYARLFSLVGEPHANNAVELLPIFTDALWLSNHETPVVVAVDRHRQAEGYLRIVAWISADTYNNFPTVRGTLSWDNFKRECQLDSEGVFDFGYFPSAALNASLADGGVIRLHFPFNFESGIASNERDEDYHE